MADKEASLLIRIKEAGSEALDRVGAGLKAVGKVGAAAFTALSAVVVKAIAEYGQTERAVNSLNQALIQQGIYSKDLLDAYRKMADAQAAKSLFDDAEIIKAQSIMQSYLGQTRISDELLKATLDLAQAKGMDLAGAAEMVAKSIGTSTNALARQGIKLKEGLSDSEKLAAVTEQLNRKFGGQAEAATKGLGAIVMLRKATNDLFEALGERLQPVIVLVANSLREMTDEVRVSSGAMSGLTAVVDVFARGAVYSFSFVREVAMGMSAAIATISGALGQLAQGQFRQAIETMRAGNEAANEDLVRMRQQRDAIIRSLDEAKVRSHQEDLRREEEMLVQSLENRTAIAAEKAAEDKLQRDLASQEIQILDQEELQRVIQLEQLKNDAEFMAQMKSLEQQKKYFMSKKALAELDLEQQKLIQNKLLDWEKLTSAQRINVMSAVGNHAMELGNNLVTLTRGTSKELIVLQRALGIAMVIVNGEVAKMRALAELGPFYGGIAAGIITANQAVSIGIIASQGLAEGGIVKARPGGMLATIGEGGRDEAVIPLEDGMPAGGMGGVTVHIHSYGGLLGDAQEAREFAIAVDRELYKLRRSNASVAFDSDLT